ncbi:MAG TPA: NAD(P)-dependent oxidoreductase [Acidimicrobiales bacterium]|nr:NAD(P)-dependent oxidoreductase [Acidimicrobiales bacterium]
MTEIPDTEEAAPSATAAPSVAAGSRGSTAALRGSTIVVTGVTGQVAEPLARALAENNVVFGAARFKDTDAKARLEEAGVKCLPVDLSRGQLDGLPSDAEYVLNFAVAKSNDWGTDLDANCGGLALLMEHHRGARAFLHCSSTAVYKPNDHKELSEEEPLGDNHGVWPFLRTYSISKIAAEAVARWGARRFGLPTTIARLSVPYGSRGGWPAIHVEMLRNGSAIPVHTNGPSVYHPIHEDDILSTVPGMLGCASVPATIVNWGGDRTSIEEWTTYLAGLCGLEARFGPTDATIESVSLDLSKMHELVGNTKVTWREGMRRMAVTRWPDLVR